ncbi:efflux RND transporter periplasmic adaptor subunit [Holophaga foetida]|uniref:efflux RND transporter periplasmic adaptor subunit n=1 Tax=Holophaga foetida TaxID=35839 RepID=UPI000247460E|nr:efflux RND transporter periplasmic adaptor subunit [Holophaga foetida]
MKKPKILPIVAGVGLLFATAVALRSNTKKPAAIPIAQPAEAPYTSYLGGAGLVEASNDNISIGTSLPGIVKLVSVKVGDKVKAGQSLFQIDDREQRADMAVKQGDLAKAEAALQEALASQKDTAAQFALVKDAKGSAVSVDDIQKRQNAAILGDAKVQSARAAVQYARANLATTQSALERLTVRAPMAGEVLQVNVRPGEYAATGVLDTPLVRLGSLEQLHIRVDIDENDAWRFKPGTRATAFLRGNRDIKAAVTFARVEPYVTPKTSLTGSSSERVDTRVLQVIYSFERSALPVYVGQQMDVFIETPEGGQK